jgi:hypothetical protein
MCSETFAPALRALDEAYDEEEHDRADRRHDDAP